MLTVTHGLDGPDQTFVVLEDKVRPKVLSLPFVGILIPQPDLIDSLGTSSNSFENFINFVTTPLAECNSQAYHF